MKFDIKRPDWIDCIIVILIAIFLAAGFLAISGCSFARKLDKTETKKDSISVSSIDSNWLKKVIENSAYQKGSGQELKIYAVPGRDTTINHFSTPINNYYPQDDNSGQLLAILTSWQHEQGNSQRLTVDSGNLAKDDSSAVKVDTSEKKTDTSAKTPLMMWIMLGVIIVMALKMFGGPVVSYFIGKAGYSKSNNT